MCPGDCFRVVIASILYASMDGSTDLMAHARHVGKTPYSPCVRAYTHSLSCAEAWMGRSLPCFRCKTVTWSRSCLYMTISGKGRLFQRAQGLGRLGVGRLGWVRTPPFPTMNFKFMQKYSAAE
jgi:hypothetical protein